MLRVQGHLLDESQFISVREAPGQQFAGLTIVNAAQEDSVDLDRSKPCRLGGLEPGDDVV